MSDITRGDGASLADAQRQFESQIRQVSNPLLRASGWMKFVAVLSILGVIPALMTSWWYVFYLWLPIWTASLLFQAAKHARNVSFSGSEAELSEALDKLRLYFKIMGVVALIGLITSLITLLFTLPYWLRA